MHVFRKIPKVFCKIYDISILQIITFILHNTHVNKENIL